jgi:hypothetical protein
MAEKLCIYCHKVTLNGFDETERKYFEKGSKTLHTRERCEAAKRGELETTSTAAATASKGGVIINGQDIRVLIAKIDALTLAVNNLISRFEGQGTLDAEQ